MGKQKKVLSVIIPIYNVEEVLPKALDSIVDNIDTKQANQMEIILVDDVSPDKSIVVANSYKERHPELIQIIRHEKNVGLGGARNSGIEAAQGEFVIFLDSDDWLENSCIVNLLSILKDAPKNQIFIFGLQAIREGEKIWEYLPSESHYIGATEGLKLFSEDKIIPSACNKVFPRELIGDLRFKESLYYEDLEFCPQITYKADLIKFINKSFYCYRLEGASITRQTLKEKHITDLSTVLNSLRTNIPNSEAVSNFFLGRWTYLLSRIENERHLQLIALKEMEKFLTLHKVLMCNAKIKKKYTEKLNQILQTSDSDESKSIIHNITQKIASNV